MKRLIGLFLLVLLIQCQSPEKEITKYTINQFYENTNIGGGFFSHDESKLLVSSNETGIYNVYAIDIASGERTQLTKSTEESNFAQSYFPNDERFIYSFDEGGNENYKVFMMSPEGYAKNLTPGDSVRNAFWGWSRDEERMYLMSNNRNPKYMDIYKMTIESMDDEMPIREMIYQNNDGLDVGAISPNERYYALTQAITSADGKMFLYDRETGEKTDISVHEGDATYSPQFFSLDNKNLFYLTDEGSDFVYLAKRNLETGAVEKVFETNWDVWYAYDSWKIPGDWNQRRCKDGRQSDQPTNRGGSATTGNCRWKHHFG